MSDQTAVLPPPTKLPLTPGLKVDSADAQKQGCPRCGSLEPWGAASWCPSCGFYPAFDKLPEDAAANPHVQEKAEEKKTLWQRMPRWVYVLMAGEIVIFAMSLLVALVTDQVCFERSVYSVVQLGIGAILFLTMQVWAFAKAVMSENFSPVDIIAHPLDIWEPSLRKLPQGAWKVWLAAWGLTAVICSVVIVGGIRFGALFDDWGFRQRAKQNLMQKIADAARDSAGKGAENLNDAIEDFVGEASKNVPNPDDLKKKAAEEPKQSVDCVIVGYVPSTEANGPVFKALVLAAVRDNKLRYVGTVSEGISDKLRQDLNARMPKLHRDRPFVKSTLTAKWIQPVMACRVKFVDWSDTDQIRKPIFDEQLADLKHKVR